MLEEPKPFAMPEVDPHMTLELGDISFQLGGDVSLIIDEKEPRLCPELAHITEGLVGLPTRKELEVPRIGGEWNGVLNGLPISESNNDIWLRYPLRQISYYAEKTEQLFDAATMLPFEKRFLVRSRQQILLLDEIVDFPGVVCPALED